MPDAPIVKRLIRDKKADFFHSSAYGRAQNGAGMGVASTESFAERRKIDQNRQNIRKYGDSLVAGQRFNPQGAGAARIDQPQTNRGEKATFYDGMLNTAKKNAGIEPAKTGVAQSRYQPQPQPQSQLRSQSRVGTQAKGADAVANLNQAATQRAEMSARFADKSRRPMSGPLAGKR